MSTGNEINLNEIVVKLVEQNAKTFFTKGQQLLNNAKNAVRVKLKNR